MSYRGNCAAVCAKKPSHLYRRLIKRYPNFVEEIIADLMQVDGYTEVEIAFGAKVPIDLVRRVITRQPVEVDHKNFFSLFKLYLKIYC